MARIVPYEGSSNSKIYLVGEAPGLVEELEGVPFTGGAGRILDKLLLNAGISRGECRIANVMRTRPPGNNFDHFYTDKRKRGVLKPELLAGIDFLKADIKRVKPNVVCCLGGEALKALTGKRGITNWRGSLLLSKELGTKIIPTIHPASVMRQWDFMPLVLFDLKKVKKEAKDEEFTRLDRKLVIRPTFETISKEIARLHKAKKVAFDIETTRFDEKAGTSGGLISAIGFSDSPSWAICIPFTFGDGDYFTPEVEMAVVRLIKGLLEDKGVKKIAQNAQFDIGILKYYYGIKVENLYLDTMCAFHEIYPELPKSLAMLCSIYTDQPFYKDWAASGGEKFWKYNALDACITFECAEHIERELKEFGTSPHYRDLTHPLIGVLLDMQLRGVKIDQSLLSSAKVDYAKRLVKAQEDLNEAAGKPINANSSKQLKELLYKDMKLPPKIKRSTGNVTVDEEALIKLSKKYPSPIFDAVIRVRGIRKTISTYLDAPLKDGRMHTSYNIGGRVKDEVGTVESGPETGRLSSSRSIILNSGTNLQNIPPGVCRKVFVPDKGKVLVNADLSQAEARVVAYLAEEERMIEVFEGGGDIHQLTADSLPKDFVPSGSAYKEVENPRRLFAKKHVHAFNYGEGVRTFAAMAGIAEGVAKQIQNRYFDNFPKIRAWHLYTQNKLQKSRVLTTPMGRKRMFFGRWGDQLFREAYAYVPQSTVADVLNKALVRMDKALREAEVDAQLLLQVHDSMVLQCLRTDMYLIERLLKVAFTIPLQIKGRELLIPFEVKTGSNWGELK